MLGHGVSLKGRHFVNRVLNVPETNRTAFAAARERLVEELAGPNCNITDTRVLAAMSQVPRHEFVPEKKRPLAYANIPLPIGYDQTISQPYIVALMTEQLELQPTDRVLEIGTGSGYQTAILAELVAGVYTIEIVEPLALSAHEILHRLGYKNIHYRHGDGSDGWPDAAPFNAVIVTCAPSHVPSPLIEQLKPDGRLVAPVNMIPSQELIVLHKTGGHIKTREILPVRFVPMTGRSEGIGIRAA
jgi:protein-L-isoaspartate(D-aspartate) O-methyltransferase